MRRHRPLHLRQSTVVLIKEKDLPVDVTRLRLVHVDRGDRCLVRNIVAPAHLGVHVLSVYTALPPAVLSPHDVHVIAVKT